jgi:hypothetical protein
MRQARLGEKAQEVGYTEKNRASLRLLAEKANERE